MRSGGGVHGGGDGAGIKLKEGVRASTSVSWIKAALASLGSVVAGVVSAVEPLGSSIGGVRGGRGGGGEGREWKQDGG